MLENKGTAVSQNYIARISGFSLLEMLVANAISSFVLLLLLTFYSHCLRFYFESAKFIAMLENVRFAEIFLRNHFRSVTAVHGFTTKEGDVLETMTDHQKVIFYVNKKSTSFYFKEVDKPVIAVAGDITHMHILYGVQPSHTQRFRYLFAEQIVNWSQVRLVRVDLSFNLRNSSKIRSIFLGIKSNQEKRCG